ncbi:MAG: bacillithiol biosynthesis cysteine-adding enzyme BshC [Thermoanaerobaculia bacterium]
MTVSPTPLPATTLRAPARLPALAAAFARGEHLDLLAPLELSRGAALPALAPPAVDRRGLAAGLAATNRYYGHPGVEPLVAKLARPETRVVVTGQQPGLFGGPLYTLLKAVAAVRWAEALEAAGQPAVAVFWMATEDHDFAEVSEAVLPGAEGPRRVHLGEDREPLVPVGARAFGGEVESLLAELAATAGQPAEAEGWRTLARWYRPVAKFGEAFPRLLVHWLGERAPLMLDAQLAELKAAEREVLGRLLARRREIDRALAAATERVKSRGFEPQVAFSPGEAPIFLLDQGRRRRIEWRGEDRWTLRGTTGPERPIAELAQILADNPLIASPGVLARPAVQDAVLGTSLFVLGPGELSYMAQVAAIYPLLEVAPSTLAFRPQALVLEEKQVGWLAQLGLDLATVLGDRGELDRLLGAGQATAAAAQAASRVEAELAALREQALALDPSLETPWTKTREQIARALATFGEKVTAAAARKNELAHRRVEQLRNLALPGGKLQERTIAAAALWCRYGDRLIQALFEQMDLGEGQLQVIRL